MTPDKEKRFFSLISQELNSVEHQVLFIETTSQRTAYIKLFYPNICPGSILKSFLYIANTTVILC